MTKSFNTERDPRVTDFIRASPGRTGTTWLHEVLRGWLWLPTILAVVLAIVAAHTTARRIAGFSWRYSRPDFRTFYSWSIDRRDGKNIWTEPAVGMVRPGMIRRFCNFTPFFVEAFSPLARFNAPTAHAIWQGVLLTSLVGALVLLARGIDPSLDVSTTVIFVALALFFQTTREVLKWSNMEPVLLLPLVISWLAMRRSRPPIAGLGLAVAILLKLFPGGFAGYLLFKRRWRELGWTAVFCLAGIAISGPQNWVDLFSHRA